MAKEYDFLFKILLIGDMGVGKAGIIASFTGVPFFNIGESRCYYYKLIIMQTSLNYNIHFTEGAWILIDSEVAIACATIS